MVTGPILNSSGYTASSYLKEIENHKGDADRNGSVGHVERPEVPAVPVEIEEIQHVSVIDPVDEIAGGAAHHEGEPEACQALVGRKRRAVPSQRRERCCRHEREYDRFERKLGRIHQSKRRAEVVHASQVEESRNDFNAVVQAKTRADESFHCLVDEDDERREREFEFEAADPRHQRLTGSASASTHRSQIPAQSGSVRTDGTNRQHRSHCTPPAFSTATSIVSAPSGVPTCSVTSDTMNSIGR